LLISFPKASRTQAGKLKDMQPLLVAVHWSVKEYKKRTLKVNTLNQKTYPFYPRTSSLNRKALEMA